MTSKLLAVVAILSLAIAGAAIAARRPQAKKPSVHQVEVAVTSDGFQPAEIKTRAGEPLRLVITRKTDRTCAKEIVIQDLGIRQPLPLDQPVTVDLTPKSTGKLRYACAMDMVAGVIVVE